MTETIVNLLILLIPALSFFAIIAFWYYRYQKVSKIQEENWERRLQVIKSGRSIIEDSSLSLLSDDKKSVEKTFERIFQSKIIRINDMSHWLKRTGHEISPIAFVGACVALFIFTAVALGILYDLGEIYVAIISSVVGVGFPFFSVNYMIAKRKTEFLKVFPNALDMIRRALKAGHTPSRAMEMVANEVDAPVGPIFRLIVDRMSLGETLENALGEASSRLDIDDFHFLAVVMILQKETGGSLSEAVENLAALLRERNKLRMKVKALSAEGKAGGVVLTGLPFIFLGLINFISPQFLKPLFTTDTGHTLLTVAACLMVAGVITISKMIKIDM